MKIPIRLNIGVRQYWVLFFNARHKHMGFLRPLLGTLSIATHWHDKRRKPADIAETFWHEVTHAILHDMDHPLWKDEKFVTAFSKRLSKAIDSARFE